MIFFIVRDTLYLYASVLLLRAWMQLTHCDYHSSLCQVVVKLTQPVLNPLRRVFPLKGSVDIPAIVLACIICLTKPALTYIYAAIFIHHTAPLLVHCLIPLKFAVLMLVKKIGLLIFWVVMARAFFSYINIQIQGIYDVLTQLTEPLMQPIRKRLPKIGSLDLAPFTLVASFFLVSHLIFKWVGYIWYGL